MIADYKKVDGELLNERNSRGLQDDYVKFLRFAQWKVEQAGRGVVGMITNHSYLDNPTFRGMRQSLMGTFDDIYILDLHGNSLKGEIALDGSADKNVFDIRQGVAIAFFVKRGGDQRPEAIVHHAELYGTRESKYAYLNDHDSARTKWQELTPHFPSFLFVPRDDALEADYMRFMPVHEIFSKRVTGLYTARDRLAIHWSVEDVWSTVVPFSGMDPELARQGYQLGEDSQEWKVDNGARRSANSAPNVRTWFQFCTGPLTCAIPITPVGQVVSSVDPARGYAPHAGRGELGTHYVSVNQGRVFWACSGDRSISRRKF